MENPDCTCEHGHYECSYEWNGWCSRDIDQQNHEAQLALDEQRYYDYNN
jgi:hypothetical protein